MTNAERILSMTIEDLRDFLVGYGCPPTEYGNHGIFGCQSPDACDECWLCWLHKEAEENEK